MFCEAIADATVFDRSEPAFERAFGGGAAARRPSLSVSLRHCPDCGTSLRVYASVQQILAGTVDLDCPDCGREMEPATEPRLQREPGAARRPRAGAAPSAFAA